MDIEKTIEYLENVMSSEVRILTLKKEIKFALASIKYSNEYVDFLREGQIDRISIPNWVCHPKYKSDNYFDLSPSFDSGTDRTGVEIIPSYDMDYKNGWRYRLMEYYGDIQDQGYTKTYGTFVHKNPYYDKCLDLYKEILSVGDSDSTSAYSIEFINKMVMDAVMSGGSFFANAHSNIRALRRSGFEREAVKYFGQFTFTKWEKTRRGKYNYYQAPSYTEEQILKIVNPLYRYYCEELELVKDFINQCYDHLVWISVNEIAHKKNAKKTLPLLRRMLAEEKKTLSKLYGLDVIYEKYRNIVALGSFIDYFASGRCSDFTGSDGAYNLYETELRLDRISDKLDVIISKLDDIQKNQRAMYLAVTEMNMTLSLLHSTIGSATDNIIKTIKEEGSSTSKSISSYLSRISSNVSAIKGMQQYSNKLLEINNERQKSIVKNQGFEQLLFTDPTALGGRKISSKAYGKYH